MTLKIKKREKEGQTEADTTENKDKHKQTKKRIQRRTHAKQTREMRACARKSRWGKQANTSKHEGKTRQAQAGSSKNDGKDRKAKENAGKNKSQAAIQEKQNT